MSVFQLHPQLLDFPHPQQADQTGLLAFGGDLSVARLERAYSLGIFPWFNQNDPILWWLPAQRAVLFLDHAHISKNLLRIIKRDEFQVQFNTNFTKVILACAKMKRKNQNGTWITDQMIQAYINMHDARLAHSIEVYFENELVGGLYGVFVNNIFSGESMFHQHDNASKVAMSYLIAIARHYQFRCIDCQIQNNFLKQFGVKEIQRNLYLRLIDEQRCNTKIEINLENLSISTLKKYLV